MRRVLLLVCLVACARQSDTDRAGLGPLGAAPAADLQPPLPTPRILGITDSPDRFITVDLGTKRVENSVAGPFQITLGPSDGSVMIVSTCDDGETSLQVTDLISPKGHFLAQGVLHFGHKSRSVSSSGTQAIIIPESADFDNEFVPGMYTFTVSAAKTSLGGLLSGTVSADGTDVHVFAFVKPKLVDGTKFLLDVNLFFSGSAGLTSETAKTNPRLIQAIEEMRRIWGQAGIAINVIRHFDISDDYQTIVGSTPGQAPSHVRSIADLFRLSDVAPKGLNFFFVEDLDPAPMLGMHGYILGVAGGIPGPGLTPGTDRSGVVVLFERAIWAPLHIGSHVIKDDWLGTTMAHEGGHFLGLSHVYERNPFTGKIMANDNISDTPEGSDLTHANEYLMQPAATSNGGKISPIQAKTLQRNPLVSF